MKSLIKGTVAGMIVSVALSGMAMAQTIRMGTEGAYPPYNFINDAGQVDGFEREVGDELCKRAGLTCEWVTNEWDSIIPNLVSGNYDTIIAGMSITAERDKVIDFTQDYYPASPSFFVALSGQSVDLKGGVIAAQSATIQAGFVAESGATLVEFATPDETIQAMDARDLRFPAGRAGLCDCLRRLCRQHHPRGVRRGAEGAGRDGAGFRHERAPGVLAGPHAADVGLCASRPVEPVDDPYQGDTIAVSARRRGYRLLGP